MPPDVFLSYAHADNETADGQAGLITRLQKYIEVMGQHKYGRKLEIFIDQKLASGENWEEAIFDSLASCRVFIPVISRTWARSRWAGIEWKMFLKRAHDTPELGSVTRIIPVSFELDDQKINELPDEQRAFQFKRRFQDGMSKENFEKVAIALAQDLSDRLDKLDEIDRKKKVFLGFAFSDKMKSWRDSIKNDLEQWGYVIREVPHDPYDPLSTAEGFREAVKSGVAGCKAVVHFLEDRPGPIPIQCEAVKQAQRRPGIELFWLGPDLRIDDIREEQYRKFVRSVDTSDENVAEFSQLLRARLKKEEVDKPARSGGPQPNRPIICLICESGDQDVAAEIRKHFSREKGWAVSMPNRTVEQKLIRQEYAEVFRNNEYFLFYWGQGGPTWCDEHVEHLMAARNRGGGRMADPAAAVVYFGQERLEYKEKFFWPWGEARQYDRFDPKALADFIKDVENSLAQAVLNK